MVYLTNWTKWFILTILINTICLSSCSKRVEAPNPMQINATKSSCSIFKDVGVNDLSINDVVVKSALGNVACIKARFSLAIKVEALNPSTHMNNSTEYTKDSYSDGRDTSRIVLGYLPLDSIVSVEDSCPQPAESAAIDKEGSNTDNVHKHEDPEELDMIILFECGKLAFNFKREDSYYMSSIKGFVNLDSTTMREFVAEKPMLFTSDLAHHFRYNELIEVEATTKTKAFILTADFYHLEYEAFRSTTSRDFVKPPDDQSKPFLESI